MECNKGINMSDQQCCGACKYWQQWNAPQWKPDLCQCNAPMPEAVYKHDATFPIFSHDGTDCPCLKIKESQ